MLVPNIPQTRALPQQRWLGKGGGLLRHHAAELGGIGGKEGLMGTDVLQGAVGRDDVLTGVLFAGTGP